MSAVVVEISDQEAEKDQKIEKKSPELNNCNCQKLNNVTFFCHTVLSLVYIFSANTIPKIIYAFSITRMGFFVFYFPFHLLFQDWFSLKL